MNFDGVQDVSGPTPIPLRYLLAVVRVEPDGYSGGPARLNSRKEGANLARRRNPRLEPKATIVSPDIQRIAGHDAACVGVECGDAPTFIVACMEADISPRKSAGQESKNAPL